MPGIKHFRVRCWSLVASLLVFTALAGWSGRAHAADWRTVCFDLRVDTTDSGIGEDYWNDSAEYYPASYGKVRIKKGGVILVNESGYLDANGCVTFNAGSWGGTWSFRLYGQAAPRRTGYSNQFNYLDVRKSDGTLAVWNWTKTSDSWTSLTLKTQSNRRSNLFGIGLWAFNRLGIDRHSRRIVMRDAACPSNPDNSCYDKSVDSVYVNPVHNRKKFVIAHEVGHGVMWHQAGDYPDFTYDNPFGDWGDAAARSGNPTQCEWYAGKHHLHSWEYSAGGFTEGWAQFYATAIFNDLTEYDAKFHYYKDNGSYCPPCGGLFCACYLKYSPTVVNMETGGSSDPNAFLRNKCNCSGDSQLSSCSGNHSVKAGAGNELDWARQLWDFQTNSGSKPSWGQTLAIMADVARETQKYDAWDEWKEALQEKDAAWGTSFWARFNSFDGTNGVNFCQNGVNC